MKSPFTLAVASSLILASGCVNLAPEYQRPDAPVPKQWSGATTGTAADLPDAISPADIGWRQFFADTKLQELIELALANNRDLRVATLNIEKARAMYRIQRADLLPTIGTSAVETSQRLSSSQSTTGNPQVVREYSADLGFSTFELDLFGQVRSLRDSALEQYLATGEARRSAQISLISEVANAYLALAADQERLMLAQETLQSQRKSYQLTQRSYEVGVSSELDLRRSQTSVDVARVDIAGYTTQVARDRNALNLLVGTFVNGGSPTELAPLAKKMPELPADLPAEVLLRRPDILQTEHNLRSANANIGAARAAFFPGIALTGSVGTASNDLSGLFEAASRTWSFVPQITLPIFNAGRLRANLEVRKIERDILVAQYQQAIQSAFRDVADALASRASIGDQLSAQRSLTEAARISHDLSNARYRKGIDNYLNVLDSQRTLYAAQQTLISIELANAVSLVNLYKALGGGWQETGVAVIPDAKPR